MNIKSKKQNVMSYLSTLESEDRGPLYFSPSIQRKLKKFYDERAAKLANYRTKGDAVKDLIIKILSTTVEHPSYRAVESKIPFCYANHRRSTIDIYRHLMSVMGSDSILDQKYPITLFDVMRVAYKIITQDNYINDYFIVYNYCSYVKRLVFRYVVPYWSFRNHFNGDNTSTEYGFLFGDFKNIR